MRKWTGIFALVSMALIAALLAGWLRSYWVYDCQRFFLFAKGTAAVDAAEAPSNKDTILTWGSTRGGILLSVERDSGNIARPAQAMITTHTQARVYPHLSSFGPQWQGHEFFGMAYLHYYYSPPTSDLVMQSHTVVVPYPIPFVALLAIFALWLRAFQRVRMWEYRRSHALCVNCGYDIRANTDVCPECGREVKSKKGMKRGRKSESGGEGNETGTGMKRGRS